MTQPDGDKPTLSVDVWLNTQKPVQLDDFLGKIVFVEVFQMLCPGCVLHGLPQAQRVQKLFGDKGVQVIGLHSVFEHHPVQGTREALAAFLDEYRISFPVGIDRQIAGNRIPETMAELRLQGTPTCLLIDHTGRLREQRFGTIDDLTLGAIIGALLKERDQETKGEPSKVCSLTDGCT